MLTKFEVWSSLIHFPNTLILKVNLKNMSLDTVALLHLPAKNTSLLFSRIVVRSESERAI